MRTMAKEIQCAAFAGLTLVAQKEGKPQYMGSPWQWNLYENNLKWVDEKGYYLWEKVTHDQYKSLEVKHL